MRIWLLTIGEPLPTDENRGRLLRTGILSELLARRGHQVIWWTSTFNHATKGERFDRDTRIRLSPTLELSLIYAPGYARNISLKRILHHVRISRRFRALAEVEEKPDVVVASYPTIELSWEATDYGGRHRVPSILDIRDLWPDIFLDLFPRWTRGAMRLILSPLFRESKQALERATGIVGINDEFVKWGVGRASRAARVGDRVFPLAYSDRDPEAEAVRQADEFWTKSGVEGRPRHFVVCLFAAMGRQIELDTVIHAARKLQSSGRRLKFVLCGVGDRLGEYKRLARGLEESVIFPGWMGPAEIWTLMRRASVGLVPYFSSWSFRMSLPNKAIEYLSAGLPILSSLQGALERLLADEHCGRTYPNGDADALAGILAELADNSALIQKMAGNALKVFQERFTADRVYGSMADYIEQVGRGSESQERMNPLPRG